MSSPIFRRLFLGALLVIAITVGGLDLYLTRFVARGHVQEVEQKLAAEGRVLAGEMSGVARAQLEPWAKTVGARTGARVTVIDKQGTVLADSESDPGIMENHAGRPEVREALQGRLGSSTRHSATLNRDLSYVALPVEYQGESGFVLRLSLPLEEIDAAIAAVRRRILQASGVAALAALAIAWVFSRSLTQRISRLKAFAESLLKDRSAEAAVPFKNDELGALARAMSQMAAEIRGLIERSHLELARREAILAGMAEGVLAVDHELQIVFSNASFARAVGAQYPVPEKLPLVQLVRDPELLEILSEVVASGEPVKMRVELRAARNRSFQVQAVPLVTGASGGALAILYDITDLERLERVRKDFVANVSHELRTPLTAIRGCAETLLDGALEDEANNRKFVEIIRAHAIRLNNIASDLLALSELEAGKQAVEPQRVSVRAALEAALLTVSSEARVRGVSVHAGEIENLEVTGHRLRLEQALVNLLDNAVKFNRPGGEVRVEIRRTPDNKVGITIADTGLGIPSEDLPRIFERFYRVDKARSREMGGTGLGLSIVKHVVESMNGSVGVESRLGTGSTFSVLLPCAAAGE